MERDRDREYFGTPERVVAAGQDSKKKRQTPTGQNTEKAYFYNTGEQVKKGDRVTYRKKEEIVTAGAGGDTLNPCVKLKNGKAPRVSYLTFLRREHPEAMTSKEQIAVDEMAAGSIFEVANNGNNNNNAGPVAIDMLKAMEEMIRRIVPEMLKASEKPADAEKVVEERHEPIDAGKPVQEAPKENEQLSNAKMDTSE